MADLTSSLNSLSDALSSLTSTTNTSQTQADLLVEAFKRTQSAQVDRLKERKSTLEKKSTFFATLNSKINTLASYIDKFSAASASTLFVTRSVTSSDSTIVSATATSEALVGLNSVKVNRLASNDILISARLNASDPFSVTGSNLTFKINGKDVTVSIDSGSTNEQALSKIATAINNTSDVNVTASTVKDTSSTIRLTITAKNTGTENKITFDDNGSGVLNALGFSNVDPNAVVRTPTQSGNEYAHYKIADSTQLDSESEVNGILVTRGSNSLSDVIQGLTITLLKAQDASAQPITLTTEVDSTAVQNLIKPLLDSYNDILQYLDANKSVLKDEPLIRNLGSNLRVISSQAITSAQSGNPQYLYEIGIKASSNGTLAFYDTTKLTDALKSDAQKVSDLFTSSDSFVAKINNTISLLKGDSGYITTKTTNVRNQIDQVQKRIAELETKIDIQAENYRKEYIRTLEIYLKAQQQYNNFYTTSNALLSSLY